MHILNTFWHFARAMAFLHVKNMPEVEKEKSLFEQGNESLNEGEKIGSNSAHTIFAIASLFLDAALQYNQGNIQQAIEQIQQAVVIQDNLYYNEPPDWFFPIRETLAALLYKNQQYADAARIFSEDLNRHPRNGKALFGLWQSIKMLQQNTDALWVEREYETAWNNADAPLTMENIALFIL